MADSDPAVWVVDAFGARAGGKRSAGTSVYVRHIPLAFGMGAVWGTVSEATFYHWGGKNYFPAVQIDRELRFS